MSECRKFLMKVMMSLLIKDKNGQKNIIKFGIKSARFDGEPVYNKKHLKTKIKPYK